MSKYVTAPEAMTHISAGQHIFLGTGASEPQTLVEALVEDKDRLSGCQLVTGYHEVSPCPYLTLVERGYFKFVSFMVSAKSKRGLKEGFVDYIPANLFEIASLIEKQVVPVDVALLQVSPPNDQGLCSLGISVDYNAAAFKAAKLVIAEVNDQMPWTYGDGVLPVSKIDFLVNTSRPLLEFSPPRIGDAERKIGEYVNELIDDGATLQLGLGAIPDVILKFLENKRELGVHSGMLTDSIIALIERGVITNSRKGIDEGKSITGTLLGTKKLYRYVHNNPSLLFKTVNYTHNALVISRINKFTSVNSALQVDLWGQINAESLNGDQLSGVGGQLDFIRAAVLSPGGKSIVALPSTSRDGKNSRIVRRIQTEDAITTPRHETHYVVTEFGIADLKGKSLGDRARALKAIAHPDFRDRL